MSFSGIVLARDLIGNWPIRADDINLMSKSLRFFYKYKTTVNKDKL